MENTLFAPFDTALIIFLSFFTLVIIVLLFWIFVINRKKHVPTQTLTEQQKANIVCCGLLHFTNQSAVDAILNDDCIIRPSKDFIYRAEKTTHGFSQQRCQLKNQFAAHTNQSKRSEARRSFACILLE